MARWRLTRSSRRWPFGGRLEWRGGAERAGAGRRAVISNRLARSVRVAGSPGEGQPAVAAPSDRDHPALSAMRRWRMPTLLEPVVRSPACSPIASWAIGGMTARRAGRDAAVADGVSANSAPAPWRRFAGRCWRRGPGDRWRCWCKTVCGAKASLPVVVLKLPVGEAQRVLPVVAVAFGCWSRQRSASVPVATCAGCGRVGEQRLESGGETLA